MRFPAPQAGFFLLSGQEKETKEKAARSRRLPLALLASVGLARRYVPMPAGSCAHPCAHSEKQSYSSLGCDARRRLRGLEKTNIIFSRLTRRAGSTSMHKLGGSVETEFILDIYMSSVDTILQRADMEITRTPQELCDWVDSRALALSKTDDGKRFARSGALLPKKLDGPSRAAPGGGPELPSRPER